MMCWTPAHYSLSFNINCLRTQANLYIPIPVVTTPKIISSHPDHTKITLLSKKRSNTPPAAAKASAVRIYASIVRSFAKCVRSTDNRLCFCSSFPIFFWCLTSNCSATTRGASRSYYNWFVGLMQYVVLIVALV